LIVAAAFAAIHERHVTAFDKARITDALPECVYAEGVFLLSPAAEQSDRGYRFVCPHREWRKRRSAASDLQSYLILYPSSLVDAHTKFPPTEI